MHLRRTSWIALALAVSLGIGGWSPDATANRASWRQKAPPTQPSRQQGFMGSRTLAALAVTALLTSTCTIGPTMEGRLFPTGEDRRCTAAHVEATGAATADYRAGTVLVSFPRLLTHSGVTWDSHAYTGAKPDAFGAPLFNWASERATRKEVASKVPLNGSLGGMTVEKGCEGARQPWLGTLFGAGQRVLRVDEAGN